MLGPESETSENDDENIESQTQALRDYQQLGLELGGPLDQRIDMVVPILFFYTLVVVSFVEKKEPMCFDDIHKSSRSKLGCMLWKKK